MSTIRKIKESLLQARKDKDSKLSSLLSTLLSEVVKVGKDNGNRETTDQEAISVVKYFIKNINQTIELLSKKQIVAGVESLEVETLRDELTIYEAFLPTQLTEVELTALISKEIAEKGYSTVKDMGKVMTALNDSFKGLFDGKLASELIKKQLC